MQVTLKLWLHRDVGDAWLVSRGGLGAGVFVPKSQLVLEAGHAVPTLVPVGPVAAEMPGWLAEEKGLIDVKVEGQGDLF